MVEEEKILTRGSTAHTISQRLRTLKKIPPELIPLGRQSSTSETIGCSHNLGIVVSIAVSFACYSMGRKLIVDKQMRLTRQNRQE